MSDLWRPGRLRLAAPGFCLLVCLAATGCGGKGSVTGKVSYKGEPLGGGTVLFYSEGQGTASSPIGPDGSYKVDKVPAGEVKIGVETKSVKPAANFNRPAMPTPPPDALPKDAAASIYGPPSQPMGKFVAIPDSYADPKSSGLTYTVKPGPQPYDIDLK